MEVAEKNLFRLPKCPIEVHHEVEGGISVVVEVVVEVMEVEEEVG